MSGWRFAIGIDPSTSSTGWCVLAKRPRDEVYGVIDTGQCHSRQVHKVVGAVVERGSVVDAVTCETIYQGQAGHGRKTQPITHYKMGLAAGGILGAMLATYAEGADVWMPTPDEWRKILGIKKAKRDVVNARVHAWASAYVGESLVGPRGGKRLDEANAIGIACAGVVRRHRRHDVGG